MCSMYHVCLSLYHVYIVLYTLVYQFVQTGVGLENEGRFLALPRVCDGLPWVSYATKTNF